MFLDISWASLVLCLIWFSVCIHAPVVCHRSIMILSSAWFLSFTDALCFSPRFLFWKPHFKLTFGSKPSRLDYHLVSKLSPVISLPLFWSIFWWIHFQTLLKVVFSSLSRFAFDDVFNMSQYEFFFSKNILFFDLPLVLRRLVCWLLILSPALGLCFAGLGSLLLNLVVLKLTYWASFEWITLCRKWKNFEWRSTRLKDWHTIIYLARASWLRLILSTGLLKLTFSSLTDVKVCILYLVNAFAKFVLRLHIWFWIR